MKVLKYLVIAGLILGAYTFQQASKHGKLHKAFARDVQEAVAVVDVAWSDEEGYEILMERVLDRARRHQIPLYESNVDLRYSRRVSTGKTSTQTNYDKSQNAMITREYTNYQAFASARVTISYDRKITPFYTKHLEFTRASKQATGALREIPDNATSYLD